MRNQIAVRIDEDVEADIHAMARVEGRSFSETLRRLLREAVMRHKIEQAERDGAARALAGASQ